MGFEQFVIIRTRQTTTVEAIGFNFASLLKFFPKKFCDFSPLWRRRIEFQIQKLVLRQNLSNFEKNMRF